VTEKQNILNEGCPNYSFHHTATLEESEQINGDSVKNVGH